MSLTIGAGAWCIGRWIRSKEDAGLAGDRTWDPAADTSDCQSDALPTEPPSRFKKVECDEAHKKGAGKSGFSSIYRRTLPSYFTLGRM